MKAERIRPPQGLDPAPRSLIRTETEEQLRLDRDFLAQIAEGLDRLEDRVKSSPVFPALSQRGYFSAEHDDRVRRGLLIYRNYRIAAYEILFRYRDYPAITDDDLRMRAFLVAYATALVLYAKSLKIIELVEHVPALRAKLNEPDVKFDLAEGFFEDVLAGYSSLQNYRSIRNADAFWRANCRKIRQRGLHRDPDWGWIIKLIRQQRQVVRRRLLHVLLRRLGHDWRAFWRTTLGPAKRTRYNLQTFVGGGFAGVYITAKPAYALNQEVLTTLRPLLRPGDLFLCRTEGKLTAALLPGFWSHAGIFIGSREELDELGLFRNPLYAKHRNVLPEHAGRFGLAIEAVSPRVRITTLEESLSADHVAVLRPNLPPEDIVAAIGEALGHLGKPYDFEFDFNVTSRIVCTELIYRSYQGRGGLRFELVKRLGRFTLTGDDIVNAVLDQATAADPGGQACLQPVAVFLKRKDGAAHAVPAHRLAIFLRRIRRGWRPARRAPSGTRAPVPQVG